MLRIAWHCLALALQLDSLNRQRRTEQHVQSCSYTYTLLIVIDVKLRLNFRSYHRHSPRAKDPRRRVRIHRYWNEDFLVAVQFSKRQFNDLYVWRWKECQQPEFMYNYDLYNEYPQVIQIF